MYHLSPLAPPALYQPSTSRKLAGSGCCTALRGHPIDERLHQGFDRFLAVAVHADAMQGGMNGENPV
jgi:hypothetical protein